MNKFDMKNNLVVILFQPQNSGNIGAVARAMKNMGVYQLRLVDPQAHHYNKDAIQRAVDAFDILENVEIYMDLELALKDCHQIVGTSRKLRQDNTIFLNPDEFISRVKQFNIDQKIGLLFGREDRGLKNEELILCDYVVTIPTSKELPSLNLSHAVLLMLYEVFKTFESLNIDDKKLNQIPVNFKTDSKSRQDFYIHLEEALREINYLHGKKGLTVMRDLRNIFNRTHLEEKDISMLRGICRQILNIKHQD